MKKFILLLLILAGTLNSFSQAVVEFKSSNQELLYDESTTSIKLQIQISNIAAYNQGQHINILLTSDVTDQKVFYGVLTGRGMDIVEAPVSNHIREVTIPVNPKLLDSLKKITFKLSKAGINPGFTIGRDEHTAVPVKKQPAPSTVISVARVSEYIKCDYLKRDTIQVPVLVKAKGALPVTKDSLRVRFTIKDFPNVKIADNNFSIVGEETRINLKICKTKDTVGGFNDLIERGKIIVVIDTISHKSKKKITIDKNQKSFTSYLKEENKPENRYSFFVGTNFDLKDNFEATSYYAEISAFLPDLNLKVAGIPIGLRAGIYKNNSSSKLDSTSIGSDSRMLPNSRIINQTNDSIMYQTYYARRSVFTDVENLGLYFQVLFQVHVSKNFKLYSSYHFEIIERKERVNFDYSEVFFLSQSTISNDSLANNTGLQQSLTAPNAYVRKYYNTHYGVGLPMFITNNAKTFEVFLNPVMGIGKPGLVYYDRNSNKINTGRKMFGIFQFALEEKTFGIRLSGEVRRYFDYPQDPFVVVNLSKRFDLSSLFKSGDD